MTIATRERYTELIKEALKAELVTKDGIVFNTIYEGSPMAGAVKIPVVGKVNVKDYDKETGVALDYVTTSYETLLIDKDIAVNELIDGFVSKAVTSQMIANRLNSASYSLAYSLDKSALDMLKAEGTDLGAVSNIETGSVFEEVLDVRVKMDKANVSKQGRYLLVSPEVYALLLGDTKFIKESDLGQEILKTGAVGQYLGFNVYETNNMKDVDFIAGHRDLATRVVEFSVPVGVNDLADGKHIGSSALQGRLIYGQKVTHKEGIFVRKSVA